VNIFVPSGGGQWQIQGPILIDAAKTLGVDLGITTMSLAYGDQLTNMLQPFWALPLLSVTGLKAKDILPYSIMFMLVGAVIFTLVLFIF
jgi:short-chain fatty acids transporter